VNLPPEGTQGARAALRRAAALYQQEADLLGTAYDGSWRRMPALRQAFFDRCHTSCDGPWLDTPIDDWDDSVRERERAILACALQIEEQAVAFLKEGLRSLN
jgi:hypothetical protein